MRHLPRAKLYGMHPPLWPGENVTAKAQLSRRGDTCSDTFTSESGGCSISFVSSAIGGGHRPSRRKRPVAEGANPTLRQRELGVRLRELRNRSDLTVEEVAEQLECSATKISRMETAARGANPRDVRDLCHIYGVTDQAEIDELMDLARQARQDRKSVV